MEASIGLVVGCKGGGDGRIVLFLAVMTIFATAAPETCRAVEVTRADETSVDLGQTLTLEGCVNRALEVNPDLKSWRYELQKAAEALRISRGNFGPSLRVNYSYNDIGSIYSNGPTDEDYLDQKVGTFDVALVQPLFSGFSNIGRYRQAKLQYEWVTHQIALKEAQIVLSVQTLYSKILQTQGNVKSLRDTMQRLRLVLKVTRAFHEVNMAPYVHVLQAGVDLADATQQLSKAENELQTRIIQLNVLVGDSVGRTVTDQGDSGRILVDFPMTEEQCLKHALENRPDLIAARKNIEIAETEVAIEFGRFYPTVNIEGHYTSRDRQYDEFGISALGNAYDRSQQNDYWTVGVNLRLSLFESGRDYYTHRKAKREVDRQKEIVRTLEDRIHSEVRTQFASMQEAKGRIEVTLQFVLAAKENSDSAGKRFELQQGTLQEVLDAQGRLTRAETQRNESIYDYHQALANLYFSIGMRNDSLTL